VTGTDAGLDAAVPPTPTASVAAHPASVTTRQGRYAGIVSRTVAISTDAVVLAAASIGTLFVLQAVVAMIMGVPFGDVTIDPEWGIAIVLGQAATYFTVGWAVFGRTGGEALFGLRLVRRNGDVVGWGRAFLRFIVSPLAYAFCGLGYVWMLVDNRRRTWADLAAGTVVVYDWRRADDPPLEAIEPHG
jgi:uncharacterized RDD family membrane protein YckC